MISVSGRPTTTKTRMVGLAQHRHRQQLMRDDEEVTSPLPEPDASRFAEAVIASVRDVAAVALEDYDKGLLSESLCKRAIAAALASQKPVLVDPARVADYSKYQGLPSSHRIAPNFAWRPAARMIRLPPFEPMWLASSNATIWAACS